MVKRLLSAAFLSAAVAVVAAGAGASAAAVPLVPTTLTKYVDPLPIPAVAQPDGIRWRSTRRGQRLRRRTTR